MTGNKITEAAMTELTPREEHKIKELAVNYFEETLGLPPRPSSADVIEGVREALAWRDGPKVREARRALRCLLLEAPESVVRDVTRRVEEAFIEIAALALPDSKPDNQGGA